ncbi:MAG: type I 3-dehydroquinate dehydratase [Calditrichia bacterium]
MPSKQPAICVSVLPSNLTDLREKLASCQDADMVEIRLDKSKRLDLEKIEFDKPVIATLRSKAEGGFWQGTSAKYTAVAQAAINAGAAYVDIEYQMAAEVLPELKRKKCGIVLSCHTSENSPEALEQLLRNMSEVKADVYKLIFTAESEQDNLTVLELIKFARQLNINYVIHAMGEAGRLSRLLGAARGNAWTYTAREFTEETAPGQLSAFESKNHFFLDEKSADTNILGLLGYPLVQSKGWRLHNLLIHKHLGETTTEKADSYLYVNFPAEDGKEFWDSWSPHLHGLSVTIPHKETIIPFLDEASNEVKISGVCNTVVRTANGWTGHNTDFIAIEALLRPYREVLGDGGVIIGTGATARSAIAALKRLNVNPVFVVGRNHERGKMLVETMGIDFLKEDEIHYANTSCVIQTTPVGMFPYVDKYPVGTSLFRKGRVVLDVVYNPVETKYLKIAKDRGCTTISGAEMFVLQAARQFELFTGQPISTEDVEKVWQEIT